MGKLGKDGLPSFPLSETVIACRSLLYYILMSCQPMFLSTLKAHSVLQVLYRDMDIFPTLDRDTYIGRRF